MLNTVYVVVWEDRHTDVSIEVYQTRKKAEAELKAWEDAYPSITFERRANTAGRGWWVLTTAGTEDDDPRGRIECHVLAPEPMDE